MNSEEQEEKSATQIAQEQIKQKAGKKAKKAIGKLGKQLSKKLVSAAAAVFKKAIVYVVSLLAPYLLGILMALLALLLVYLITTMFFTIGKSELDDDYSKELLSYIEKQVDKSVDSDKPEQQPYKVPADLVVATMQIYNSEKIGRKEKKIIKDVVKALTPTFTYINKKVTTQTKSYTCVKVANGEKKCSNTIKETTENVKVLSKVDAWDRKVSFTYKKVSSDWTKNGDETSKTTGKDKNKTETTEGSEQKKTSFEPEEHITPDYTYLDESLRKAPLKYGDNDMKMVEVLYLAADGEIYYTEWLNGEEFEFSSSSLGDVGYGDIDVTPGAGVPAEYMPFYLGAQKKYNVPWYYLASMHYQETRFGSDLSESSAGAVGHMQFMKCTWTGWSAPGCSGATKDMLFNKAIIKKYNGYGIDANGDGKADPWNPHDAIFAAGNYLHKLGFKESNATSVYKALKQYGGGENAGWYADEVTVRAKKFKEEAKYSGSESGSMGPIKVTGASDSPMMPLKTYRVTSSFGARELCVKTKYGVQCKTEIHKAMDLAAPTGTPIMAITDGEVVRSNNNCGVGDHSCGMGWGNFVWSKQVINGKPYEAVYAHMTKVLVSSGKVKKGQVIGLVGNTGDSYGSHLHIEIHRGVRIYYQNVINPATILPYK